MEINLKMYVVMATMMTAHIINACMVVHEEEHRILSDAGNILSRLMDLKIGNKTSLSGFRIKFDSIAN